jgi:hypothetical protein
MPYPRENYADTEGLLHPDGDNNSEQGMSNQKVLAVTTALFALFVIAEIIGALVSS